MDMPNYPKPVSMRSGCKVGWYTYDNREDAETAAAAARVHAEEMWARGYDFGWLVPGTITRSADGTRFTVTVP